MQEDKKEVLPAHPAASDPLSIALYNEQHIDPSVRALLTTHLTAHLHPNNKITALVLGARCGLVAEILLPFCSEMDLVEEKAFARVLEARFVEGREVDYFFGKEGFIGSRHVLPAPALQGQQVRVIVAEELQGKSKARYDLIVLQNPIITAQANLIRQLLATDHSQLLTLMIPGKITDQRLFNFFARFEKHVLPALYTPLAHQSLQNRCFITGRREEILYHEIYTFQKNEGPPVTEQRLLELLGEDKEQHQEAKPENPYEAKSMVDTYLAFHYGPSFFGIENFPKACGDVCVREGKKRGLSGRALDLGCAVGRTSLVLAEHFDEVVGVDYSQAFVDAAREVLAEQYPQLVSKVRFEQGDACNMDPALGKFSLIFGGNLIDRLHDPAAFLRSVTEFLQPGGLLVLTSPYSWLAEYTSPEKWIGGLIEGGAQVGTGQGLRRVLGPVGVTESGERENLRFVIKVNDWVYMYTLANVTFWTKQ